MDSLSDFLLARIAEDEAAADHADLHTPRGTPSKDVQEWALLATVSDQGLQVNGRPLITVAPARVRAECEAKRRLVAHHSVIHDEHHHTREHSLDGYGPGYDEGAGEACPTLRLLAAPYADHPEYREEWRA